MKVIDLLNKIANREELPKKFKYENKIYVYYDTYGGYYEENCQGIYNRKFLTFKNEQYYAVLNVEIEIIEEETKEIEKIEVDDNCIVNINETGRHLLSTNMKDRDIYITKINELIDNVNDLLKKEDEK